MKKHDLDNHSRQLNPQDPTYWSSRGEPQPSPAASPKDDGIGPTAAPPKEETPKK